MYICGVPSLELTEQPSAAADAAYRQILVDRLKLMTFELERQMLRTRRTELAFRILQMAGLVAVPALIFSAAPVDWQVEVAGFTSAITAIAGTTLAAFRFDERRRSAQRAAARMIELRFDLEFAKDNEHVEDVEKQLRRIVGELGSVDFSFRALEDEDHERT